jgi:hypothetical protein
MPRLDSMHHANNISTHLSANFLKLFYFHL